MLVKIKGKQSKFPKSCTNYWAWYYHDWNQQETKMNLMLLQIVEGRHNLKMTVLYRKDGMWREREVDKLVNGLMTEVSNHPQHPEYLVLYGHYTKEATLKALGGGQAYTTTAIIGTDNTELPFVPGFA